MQLHLHPLTKSCCLQYSRFIQLLQKLVTLPCSDIEEKYIQKFSKEVPALLQKVVIEPLKYDERGVAFSTGEGNNFKLVGNDAELFPLHTIVCTTLLNVSLLHFVCLRVYCMYNC